MPNPELLDQAFTRAAGASLIGGNHVRLLRDAGENYPAWLEAIRGAQHTILFENYIWCEDETGREFRDALVAKARTGVRVRVIYDWLGCLFRASSRYWHALRAAGIEVRCFNPPRLAAPFGALHRDHRKMLSVDGRVGFVTGLCIGRMWVGDAKRGVPPWRDTGVEIRGPAVAEIERAFAQVWSAIGPPLEAEDLTNRHVISEQGPVALRVVATAPGLSAVLRLDQLIAAAARHTLWLTDAYFAGIPPYVQALRAAARDGVDVRLLVPGASDVPLLRPLSEAGYRPLLEAGVRVFEWKGSMLHAKTAVADGRWARVGSSNLNIASWIGNFELDALMENTTFAAEMERMYLDDLAGSTEIVLRRRRFGVPRRVRRLARSGVELARGTGTRVRSRGDGARGASRSDSETNAAYGRLGTSTGDPRGSASRAAAGALRIGRTVGAALSEQRILAPTEARAVAAVAVALAAIVVITAFWPLVAAIPVMILLAWAALALFAKALALRRERRRLGQPRLRIAHTHRPRQPEQAAAVEARGRGSSAEPVEPPEHG
ncbi:MAG TPA: phospholipase D-like domain-containing protein [Steroidobacteraceae bacterium]|nr:phospholipase D-like domain-containing protein [Steroidobacteraceae bacterium]